MAAELQPNLGPSNETLNPNRSIANGVERMLGSATLNGTSNESPEQPRHQPTRRDIMVPRRNVDRILVELGKMSKEDFELKYGALSETAETEDAYDHLLGAIRLEDSSDWARRALCRQTDPEAFFPEKGGSTREAKKVCFGCEVRAECLEYALLNDERHGIWGGLSERERRRLKKSAV